VPAAPRAVLGRPAIKCQPALNKERPAFAEVLVYILSNSTERPAIYKTGLLPIFPFPAFPSTVDRQPEINDSGLAGQVRQLWVTSQTTHQQNFIKISHLKIPFPP